MLMICIGATIYLAKVLHLCYAEDISVQTALIDTSVKLSVYSYKFKYWHVF